MAGQADDCRSYVRAGHEAVRRNICHNIWICIILDCQGKSAVIFGTRPYLHAVSHFLLNHDRDIIDWNQVFKKTHNDGGRDVIWKICNNLNGTSAVILFRYLIDVNFKNIRMDNGYILIVCQGLVEYGDQV